MLLFVHAVEKSRKNRCHAMLYKRFRAFYGVIVKICLAVGMGMYVNKPWPYIKAFRVNDFSAFRNFKLFPEIFYSAVFYNQSCVRNIMVRHYKCSVYYSSHKTPPFALYYQRFRDAVNKIPTNILFLLCNNVAFSVFL